MATPRPRSEAERTRLANYLLCRAYRSTSNAWAFRWHSMAARLLGADTGWSLPLMEELHRLEANP